MRRSFWGWGKISHHPNLYSFALTGVIEFMLLGQRLPLPHGQLGAIVGEQQTATGDAHRGVHGRFGVGRAPPGRHAVKTLVELSDAGRAGRGKGACGHSRGR